MVIIYTKPKTDARFGKYVEYSSFADYIAKTCNAYLSTSDNPNGSGTNVTLPYISAMAGAVQCYAGYVRGSYIGGAGQSVCNRGQIPLYFYPWGAFIKGSGDYAICANICGCLSGGCLLFMGNLACVGYSGPATLVFCQTSTGTKTIIVDGTTISSDNTSPYLRMAGSASGFTMTWNAYPTSIKVVSGNAEFLRYNC